jgi:hypothetical protein
MLPAYLSYFMGLDDDRADGRATSVPRGVAVGAVVGRLPGCLRRQRSARQRRVAVDHRLSAVDRPADRCGPGGARCGDAAFGFQLNVALPHQPLRPADPGGAGAGSSRPPPRRTVAGRAGTAHRSRGPPRLLESIVFPDVIETRDVSIDGDDVVSLVQEPAGMATRAAPDVEHRTGDRDQGCKADDSR